MWSIFLRLKSPTGWKKFNIHHFLQSCSSNSFLHREVSVFFIHLRSFEKVQSPTFGKEKKQLCISHSFSHTLAFS